MSDDTTRRVRVLTGAGGGDDGAAGSTAQQGVEVDLTVIPPRRARSEPRSSEVPLPDRAAYRAVPLLAIGGSAQARLLAVGQIRVIATTGAVPQVRVVVRALWVDDAGQGWRSVDTHDRLGDALTQSFRAVGHTVQRGAAATATVIAKGLAENSRNALGEIAQLRYELENRLAEQLDPTSKVPLEPVLAEAIQLSLAIGRAGDEARSAVREGLWAWRTHKAAYHAQRRLMNPSLPEREGAAEAQRQSWFASYDAGVRQCVDLDAGVAQAAPLLDRLLSYGSTISNARDAQGQEAFNLVAAVGTVALGLPALVLSLYGASEVLPLRPDISSLSIVAPLLIAALVAIFLAKRLPGRFSDRDRLRYAATAALVLVGLLLLAGSAFVKKQGAPAPPPSPSPTVTTPSPAPT